MAALLLLVLAQPPSFAAGDAKAPVFEDIDDIAARHAKLEQPRLPYMPGPRQPPYAPLIAPPVVGPYLSIQANVSAPGINVVGDAANEPSITVDPTAASTVR